MERTDFFDKNCDIFVDQDENKLEYTAVYEKFLKLIEELIENEVKERYAVNEEEINAFFASL